MKIFLCIVFFLALAGVAFGDIIIDNGDNGTAFTGDWKISGAENYYGNDSVYCKDIDETYTFEITVNGTQEIALWWTEWTSRGFEVPVRIYNGDTLLDTVLVNQTARGGQWNVLGVYDFTGTAKVVIVSMGNSCSVCADAVRFTDAINVQVLVTWNYEYAHINEAGFTLRVNEGIVIGIPDPIQRSWLGTIGLIFGINKFDMQTYDKGGNCSIWSDPAYYTVKPEVVLFAPTNIAITEEL
jgi:hypothetical protein